MADNTLFEHQRFEQPNFPITLHPWTLPQNYYVLPHWHESLELLLFTSGPCTVEIDGVMTDAPAGTLIIIDALRIHRINAIQSSEYYCLTIDKNYCKKFDYPIGKISLRNKTGDKCALAHYEAIIREMEAGKPYYKSMVQAEVLALVGLLCRESSVPGAGADFEQSRRQLEMVRKSLIFLSQHYPEPLTIDKICQEIGFSKCYLCHEFKSATGKTSVDYLNFLRCENARYLLWTGEHNVRECAERCGFNSDSYFSKTYKRWMGELPSETLSKGQKARGRS